MPVPIADTDRIVITASLAPEQQSRSPASVTIIDARRIERLGEPLIPALLRLVPSASVSASGPAGSLTEVRIRGAEANHSLLFIDGVRANDPASGDTARFEILNADLASRIEIVRGPQSALWGSEAIGGVIAVNGAADAPGYGAAAEAGAFGFRRASASAGVASRSASLSAAVGWQRATGIDSFGQFAGDKDGYRNLSARLRGTYALGSNVEIGAAVFALTGRSEFDGFDTLTFAHTDTLDNSRNRLGAARLWLRAGSDSADWSAHIGASLLGSSNRNFLDRDQINRTGGTRRSFDAQLERRFATGPIAHRLIVAGNAERETFTARDTVFGGFTNQDRNRSHNALTAEWRGETERFTGDLAVRRDMFNRFRDATSLRASLLARVGGGFALAGSYAEGIAQPTFFDLYGFFPGSFVGNRSLRPERSRGFEASLRFRRAAIEASLTGYRQRLRDEIVDVFDFTTFLSSTVNREGASHRSGVEAEVAWRVRDRLRLSANYAYLHATQPGLAGQITELRRPRHSGSLTADGAWGAWTYGASLAYVGSHVDRRDVAPFDVLRLKSYWLAGARVAYSLRPGMEAFVRGSNLLGERYQDTAGYRTEGRGLFVGISLREGRRSSP